MNESYKKLIEGNKNFAASKKFDDPEILKRRNFEI